MTDELPELERLGEVKPGGSYLLRLTELASPQAAMRAREQLERTFPGTTFGILTHNLEPVVPIPVPPGRSFVGVLRDLAFRYSGYAAKTPPGGSKAAFQIVANALLDLKVELERTEPPGDAE